jgi:DNA polymerase-1
MGQKITNSIAQICRQRMLDEISGARPRVVLALGNWALRGITGDYSLKITAENAVVRDWGDSKLVPCLHPAGVMRNPGSITQFRHAIKLAVDLVKGIEREGTGEVSYFVAKDHPTAQKAFHHLWNLPWGHLLGADIETTGFSPFRDRIMCMGIAYEKNKVIVLPPEFFRNIQFRKWLELLMRSRKFRWGWHGGKFDVKFLRHLGIPARIDEDSMLQHYTLEEQSGTHGLEQLSSTILGAPPYKGQVEEGRKNGWVGASRKDLFRYQAEDADYTRQLILALREPMHAVDGLKELYNGILIPVANFLANVELRGMPFNIERAKEAAAEIGPQWEAEKARLNTLIAERWPSTLEFKRTGSAPPLINPNSPQQVEQLVYDWLGFQVPKGFQKDTQKGTLTAMGHDPILESLLECKKLSKKLSTYSGHLLPSGQLVKGLQRRVEPSTGRIHTTFQEHVTTTGRLSSVQPNLQNVSRGPVLRGMFEMPEGRWFLEADLKSAELVVLANLSKDPVLCGILNSGRNLHHEVSVDLYGEGYNEDQYFRAKALNFGIMYGRMPSSLVKEYGHQGIKPEDRLTLPEAQRLWDGWTQKFKVAYDYILYLRAAPENGVNLRAPTGRRRRFGAVTQRKLNDAQNEAANFPIQGPASDIVLVGGQRNEEFAAKRDAWAVNLIHDAIYYDVPSQEVAAEVGREIARLFREVGAEICGDLVPFTAEFKFGNRWGHLQKVEF